MAQRLSGDVAAGRESPATPQAATRYAQFRPSFISTNGENHISCHAAGLRTPYSSPRFLSRLISESTRPGASPAHQNMSLIDGPPARSIDTDLIDGPACHSI
ncbi:hypothetical protein EYF80_021511 [Liparis tanakae]|uniref:Uncharacterized protein n=1 Tax=Liparis tanakae TaxID=230148 RepID=A0A4Z2HRG1_9TELE|nr:hypothetical protein EYF80_021511 [Liparis tanakae]